MKSNCIAIHIRESISGLISRIDHDDSVEMKTPLQHLNSWNLNMWNSPSMHITNTFGSYSLISEAYTQMAQELDSKGIPAPYPYGGNIWPLAA